MAGRGVRRGVVAGRGVEKGGGGREGARRGVVADPSQHN